MDEHVNRKYHLMFYKHFSLNFHFHNIISKRENDLDKFAAPSAFYYRFKNTKKKCLTILFLNIIRKLEISVFETTELYDSSRVFGAHVYVEADSLYQLNTSSTVGTVMWINIYHLCNY